MEQVNNNQRTSSIDRRQLRNRMNPFSSSSSIIARAGQVMAIIIAIGMIGLISSMLVTESLSGDAAKINQAGALRMQAIRISRAILADNYLYLNANNNSSSTISESVIKEIINFNDRINHLFLGGLTNAREDKSIEQQYQLILSLWAEIKDTVNIQSEPKKNIESFDRFVAEIDKLVTLLQIRSEQKLASLRFIQGASLFILLLIAFIVLYRLNKTIISPLKELVTVAEFAGKGNFDVKANYDADNELGVLARTINQMSDELALTYNDFENRVSSKTKALTQSNQSLQVLYQAARKLASNDLQQADQHIISELEKVLGFGKIFIQREVSDTAKDESNSFTQDKESIQIIKYPLEKPNQDYGFLIWQIPADKKINKWQTQMLRAMADIAATAIDLENRRTAENRLLIVEERAVIARELHDSLAQSLSYLKVQTSLLTRKLQKEVPKDSVEETINELKQGLAAAYQQLRELLTTFRLQLDDPSLESALHGTVIEFSEKCQHSITLDYQLPENCLTANQEIHVLQIVREALSNIHRHAKASNSQVKLSTKAGSEIIEVEIWDDGVGIKEIPTEQGHFGLGIMRERAKSLDTEIKVEAMQPSGTRVIFEFNKIKQ